MDTVKDTSKIEALISFLTKRGDHKMIFLVSYGPWPHPCYFCGESVDGHTVPKDATSAAVHHIDGLHNNNDPTNLTAAHYRCHGRHHQTGRKASNETRAKIRAERKARYEDPEYRARHAAAVRASSARRLETWTKSVPVYQCQYCEKEIRGGKGNVRQHERACMKNPARSPIRFSEETREKMRLSHIGLTASQSTCELISAIHKAMPLLLCKYCGRKIRGPGVLVLHERACTRKR